MIVSTDSNDGLGGMMSYSVYVCLIGHTGVCGFMWFIPGVLHVVMGLKKTLYYC